MTRPTLVIAGLAIPWAMLHGAGLLGPLHNATFVADLARGGGTS